MRFWKGLVGEWVTVDQTGFYNGNMGIYAERVEAFKPLEYDSSPSVRKGVKPGSLNQKSLCKTE